MCTAGSSQTDTTGGSDADAQHAPVLDVTCPADDETGDALASARATIDEHTSSGPPTTARACDELPDRTQLAARTPAISVATAAAPQRTRGEPSGGSERFRTGRGGTDARSKTGAAGAVGGHEALGGEGIGKRWTGTGDGHDIGRGARSAKRSFVSAPSASALGAGRSVSAEGEWRVAIFVPCHRLESAERAFRRGVSQNRWALSAPPPPKSSNSVVSVDRPSERPRTRAGQ